MSALKKEIYSDEQSFCSVSSEDIQNMQEFLESLEQKIRESSLSSLSRRIYKKKGTRTIRGRKIIIESPEQKFLF